MEDTKSKLQQDEETTNESDASTSEAGSWTNSVLEQPICSEERLK